MLAAETTLCALQMHIVRSKQLNQGLSGRPRQPAVANMAYITLQKRHSFGQGSLFLNCPFLTVPQVALLFISFLSPGGIPYFPASDSLVASLWCRPLNKARARTHARTPHTHLMVMKFLRLLDILSPSISKWPLCRK